MKIRESVAKLAQDAQKRNGRGKCWVCGSNSGLKMCRSLNGIRCKKCIMAGKTNNEVIMYERWKNSLRITKE